MFRALTGIFILLFVLSSAVMSLSSQASGKDSSSKRDNTIYPVQIKQVVSNPREYNDKKVSLEGEVVKVKYTTSSKDEPFTIFRLKDGDDNIVNVYYEDEHLPISKGDKVKIMGRFKKQKSYFLYKVKNVIKARTVEMI
jgi:RecJ-like exonuclease